MKRKRGLAKQMKNFQRTEEIFRRETLSRGRERNLKKLKVREKLKIMKTKGVTLKGRKGES